jgi:hypothetical protein
MNTLDYHPLGELRANHLRHAGPRLFTQPYPPAVPKPRPAIPLRRWSTLDFTAPIKGATNANPCAWCDKEHGITRLPGQSHGICERHAAEMREQLRRDAEARRPGQSAEIIEPDRRAA